MTRLILSYLMLAVLLAPGPVAQAEIPIAENTGSHEQYDAHRLELYRNWLCEPYRQRHPVDTDEDHAAALSLLEEIARLHVQSIDYTARLSLRARIKEIRKRAGDDALLRYAEAYAWGYFASTAAGKYAEAADAIAEQEYCLALAAMARMRSAEDFRLMDKLDEAARQLELSREATLSYLRKHPADVAPRLTLDVIIGPLEPERELDEDLTAFDQFVVDLQAVKGLDPWVAEMVAGRSALKRGWFIRGSGFAHRVSQQDRQRFHTNVARAEQHLKAAHALAPDRPEAAAAMIKASWGRLDAPDPEQNPRYWLEQAARAEFDWIIPYRQMSWTLLPRWGGNHAAGLAFARECAATGRYDTQVPYHAVEAVRQILRSDFDNDYQAVGKLGVFDLVEQVLNTYADRAEDPAEARTYRSELLMFACLAGQAETARTAWERRDRRFDINDIDVVDRFRGIKHFGQPDVDAVLVQTGPAAELVTQAAVADQAGQLEEALALYDQAMAAADDLPSRRFIGRSRLALAWQRSRQTGESLTLGFSEGLPGWTSRFGVWEAVDEWTVEGRSSEKGLMLQLPLDLGGRFELRGEITFVKPRYPKYYSAGVLLYDPHRVPDWGTSRFHGLLLFRDRGTLARFDPDQKAVNVADAPVQDTNRFCLRVEDGQASFDLDGKRIWQGPWFGPDEVYLAEPRLGLGGHYWYQGATLRFSKLELQALPE